MVTVDKNGRIIVDCAVLELIIPEVYARRGMFVRQSQFYKLLFVAMGRKYSTQEAYKSGKKPDFKPVILPYMITTKPTEVTIDFLEVPKGGTTKKVYILTYYRGDVLSESQEYAQSSDNTQNFYNLVDDGKGDFLPYTSIAYALEIIHHYNGTKLPVPMEAIEAITAEKCRDPQDSSKPARLMKTLPTAIQSLNPREKVLTDSTFNMLNFEDINTSLIIAASKSAKGVVDKPSTLEKIIQGDTMTSNT